jgi:hypothetical protein
LPCAGTISRAKSYNMGICQWQLLKNRQGEQKF